METISVYLDNLFKSLPESEKILQLKKELLENMEEKYEELKGSGKTENEAIGVVIAEFGNIDELIQEMGLTVPSYVGNDQENVKIVGLEEVTEYMAVKKFTSILVSVGVFIILFGISLLMLSAQLIDENILFSGVSSEVTDFLPPIFLLVMVGLSVALFIYAGMHEEPYKYFEKGEFSLNYKVKNIITKEHDRNIQSKNAGVILGTTLCILSPIALFIGSIFGDTGSVFGVCILLSIIGIAVSVFIISGYKVECYKQFLKVDDYKPKNKEENKVIGAIAAIIWPIAVCIFFVAGLVYNMWYICWIVFPITGILFGGFCAFYSAIKGQN